MRTRGSVRWSDGTPIEGCTVQVCDDDLFRDDLLRQAVVDSEGNFNLLHLGDTDPWFTGRHAHGDIYVRVLRRAPEGSEGEELWRSRVRRDCQASEWVLGDIQVDKSKL